MAEPGDGIEADGGITRREALKRGTMAGLGLVWIAPTVDSFTISAQTAQATSPVPEVQDRTGEPGGGSPTTTTDQTPSTEGEKASSSEGGTHPESPTTQDTVEGKETSPTSNSGSEVETDVLSDGLEAENDDRTDQVAGESEVSADQLPFTGLPVEQLLPLAGGAIATGVAAVHLSREVNAEPPDDAGEGSPPD